MYPRVILHNAVSLDGRVEGFAPDVDLYYSLIGRWKEQATLVGSDTLLSAPDPVGREEAAAFEPPADDPQDTRPILVVPDSRGRVRTWHHWNAQPYWRRAVALIADNTPKEYRSYLADRHVETIEAGRKQVDYRAALRELRWRHHVEVLRVDAGGTLNGLLLQAGLVDEVSLLVHPSLAGGAAPGSFFRRPGPGAVREAPVPLRLTHVERLRDDLLWLVYEVAR